MSDTQTSVEPVAPVADAPSIEDRVANLLGTEDESPAESPVPQDTQETDSDVLTPDDIPDAEVTPDPAPVEALELTYNGEPIKVNKDEAVNLAQLGLHLQRAQERVTGELQAAQQRAQEIAKLAETVAQTTPQVTQLRSQMAALQMIADSKGLNPQNIYQVAMNDPARAQEMRAELDVLDHQYKQAQLAVANLEQQGKQQHATLKEQLLNSERQLLPRLLPQVKDRASHEKVQTAVRSALANVRPQTADAVIHNAELFAMAAKAAQFDALQAGKKASLSKANQAPQMVKPGTPSQMDAKTRASLDARKEIKRAATSTDKVRAIERYLETKF